jgi:hypothetical protein
MGRAQSTSSFPLNGNLMSTPNLMAGPPGKKFGRHGQTAYGGWGGPLARVNSAPGIKNDPLSRASSSNPFGGNRHTAKKKPQGAILWAPTGPGFLATSGNNENNDGLDGINPNSASGTRRSRSKGGEPGNVKDADATLQRYKDLAFGSISKKSTRVLNASRNWNAGVLGRPIDYSV